MGYVNAEDWLWRTSCTTAFTVCVVLMAALFSQADTHLPALDSKNAQGAENASTNSGTSSSSGGEANQTDIEPRIQRLDPRVRPLLYNLSIQPFLGEGTNFTFHGHIYITFTVDKGAPGDTIVLHVKQLNISSDEISITLDSNRHRTETLAAPTIVSQQENPSQETYTLGISPPLLPSYQYVLYIPFTGQLQVATLAGFFRTPYDEDGITKWIALTHFEATEARSVFPCFDEPAFKARFQINIKHSTNYTAVSNMPIIHSEPIPAEPGWIVDHFDTSPPMSTYLVTFTVSEMVFETASKCEISEAAQELQVSASERRTLQIPLPLANDREQTLSTSINGEGAGLKRENNAALKPKTLHTDSNRSQRSNLQLSSNGSSFVIEQKKANLKRTTVIHPTGEKCPLKIRILVRPELRHKTKYALTVAPKLLKFYENYFGTPYPLSKLDFTAIPGFLYGGMENWGAITLEERRALVGPETRSDNRQTGAITIVHEFGHQWFGDLITPVWWSETWLREGFATFLEYVGTNAIEPTWEMHDKFLTTMYWIMDQDSTQFTYPIFRTVETATQIVGVFDSISYSKGACLFRMLNHSVTEDVFKTGLSIFINKWKYLNVDHDELWWSMEQAIKQRYRHGHSLPHNSTLKQVMDSWLLQPGFPVITAKRNYITGSVTISQARFSRDGSSLTNGSTQVWYVPVSYATQFEVTMGAVSTTPRIWLGVNEGQQSVTIENVFPSGSSGATQWLLINLQQSGYYKVNYDVDNWKLLAHQLAARPLQLPASVRAQLVSDALSLARAGSLPYDIALNITNYLRESSLEVNLVPWQTFLDGMQFLRTGLAPTRTYLLLKKYIVSVLVPVINHLRIEPQPNESLPTRQLRAHILSELIWLQSYNVWAQTMFAQWMASPDTFMIDPDLRPIVYCAAIMKGGDLEFYFVYAQINRTKDSYQREELLTSLMCSQQPGLIAMLLNAPLEGKILDVQDTPTVWNAVPRNPAAHEIAFDYIRQQWTNLTNRFPDTDYPINDMLQGATAGLNTQKQLDDLKEFKISHNGQFNQTSTTLQKAIESLEEVVSWRQRFESDIAEWLHSVVPGA